MLYFGQTNNSCNAVIINKFTEDDISKNMLAI